MKSILRIGRSCWRLGRSRRRGCRPRVVDQVFQFLAWLEIGYALRRHFNLFTCLRIAADTRVHDLLVDRNGLMRDSEGLTPKVGTTFELTRKLTGEISVGYLTRTYKDPTLPELRGFVTDASLLWSATALTNIKLTAKSTADESVLPGVSGAFRFCYSRCKSIENVVEAHHLNRVQASLCLSNSLVERLAILLHY